MLDLPRSHPWLEREIARAGRELSQPGLGVFAHTLTPYLCAKARSGEIGANPRSVFTVSRPLRGAYILRARA
eukprot:2655964-Prymnesium_polylepis.1